ncbi:MAG: hypothetical protein RL333_1937 [Pseudomonadota bacterium]
MSERPGLLFAYGSLQLPEVFEAVTRQSRDGLPALLEGFRRTKLKGFGFPAIVPVAGMETSGLVYTALEEDAWRRLDAFEDDFYDRKTVRVRLASGAVLEAQTYVLSHQFLHLSLDESWSLDDLDTETLHKLLARL